MRCPFIVDSRKTNSHVYDEGSFVLSKRSFVSLEIKLHVVQRCLELQFNPNVEAKHFKVSKNSVQDTEYTDWIILRGLNVDLLIKGKDALL